MRAEKFLKQALKYKFLIAHGFEELEAQIALATKTTAVITDDRVQTSGAPDKLADAVIKIIEIENDISDAINGYQISLKEITDVMNMLNHPYVEIAYLIYMDGHSLQEVSDELGYSYHYSSNLHRAMLDMVEDILSEKAEEQEGTIS